MIELFWIMSHNKIKNWSLYKACGDDGQILNSLLCVNEGLIALKLNNIYGYVPNDGECFPNRIPNIHFLYF